MLSHLAESCISLLQWHCSNAVLWQAGDKLKGKANEAGRKAQNAVGDNAGLPSPQDVRPPQHPATLAYVHCCHLTYALLPYSQILTDCQVAF